MIKTLKNWLNPNYDHKVKVIAIKPFRETEYSLTGIPMRTIEYDQIFVEVVEAMSNATKKYHPGTRFRQASRRFLHAYQVGEVVTVSLRFPWRKD